MGGDGAAGVDQEIVEGDAIPRTLKVSACPDVSVGRGQGEIPLTDPKVSRQHAKLLVDLYGNLMVFDRGSANGTYFRSEPVKFAHIPVGGAFYVGDTMIRLIHVRHFLAPATLP